MSQKIQNLLTIPVEGSLSNGISLIFSKFGTSDNINIRKCEKGKFTNNGVFLYSNDIEYLHDFDAKSMIQNEPGSSVKLIKYFYNNTEMVRIVKNKSDGKENKIDIQKKNYYEIIMPYFQLYIKLANYNYAKENNKKERNQALALDIVDILSKNYIHECCFTENQDHLCFEQRHGFHKMKDTVLSALNYFTGSGDVCGSKNQKFPIYDMLKD
jgi:hypothetical protein